MGAVSMGFNNISLLRGPAGYTFMFGVAVLTYIYALPWRVTLAAAMTAHHSGSAFYIVNVLFFAGASGGAVIIAALAERRHTDRAKALARIAEIAAFGGLIGTLIFIASDVIQNGLFWYGVRVGQLTRPLGWDLTVIVVYFGNAMALAFFAAGVRLGGDTITAPGGERRLFTLGPILIARVADRRFLRDVAVAVLPAALLLHTVPAWILGLLDPAWGWETVAPIGLFYVSSIVSGLALILVAATVRGLRFPGDGEVMRRLGQILYPLLPVLGFCLWAEMEMIILAKEPLAKHLFREMTFGSYAPLFWFVFISGVLIPFMLLTIPNAVTTRWVGLAGSLVMLAMLVERWNMVVIPLLGHAHAFYSAGGYVPGSSEVALTFGGYAVVLLLYRRTAAV